MNRNNNIRIGLFILGLLFLFLLISPFLEFFGTFSDFLSKGDFSSINFSGFNMTLMTIYFILAYICFIVSVSWDKCLKSFTKSLVSFAVLFLTITIFSFAINSNSEKLTQNIQPSIDLLIVKSMDEVLLNNLEISEGSKVNLLLSENTEIKKISVKDFSEKDIIYFEKVFSTFVGDSELSLEQKTILSKVVITEIYSELKKNGAPLEVPIPLSQLEDINIADSIGQVNPEASQILGLVDEDTLKSIIASTLDLLISEMEINQEAYINVLLLENEVEKSLEIGKIDENTLNLIWKNLGLNEDISLETKKVLIDILLSQIIQIDVTNNLPFQSIPLASVAPLIPSEIKSLLNYDLFNSNYTKRAETLKNIREDCSSNNIVLDEVCEPILLSDYGHFMKSAENLTSILNLKEEELPINPNELELEKYDSIEKLNLFIEEKTSIWFNFFLIYIFLMIVAYFTYLGHFKLFKRELIKFHVPYFLSKQNLIAIIPSFIFSYFIYYFIKEGLILDLTKDILTSDLFNALELVLSLPIYTNIIGVFSTIITLTFIYIIISIALFVSLMILLKKEVQKTENKITNIPEEEK